MKINRVLSSEAVLRGERMDKKKDKSNPAKSDSVELSSEALQKHGLDTANKAGKSKAPAAKQTAATPANKPAESYQKGRAGAEVPLRSEKIEHAKAMIQSKGYDDPQVVAAIIDRLVFALKE